MMSRPLLLLQREEYRIKTNPVWGIEANAIDGNYYHWNAKIHGLKGTSWEGGIFAIEMYFNEEYDLKPPVVLFSTVPFHPNIDMKTGKPCVDFLDNEEIWEPGTTIIGILQSLQLLLTEPVMDNAINIFAAQAYVSSPHLYNQLVKDCVVASRKVEAGLSPYNEYFGEEEEEEESKENDKKSKNDNESSTEVKYLPKTIKKISFEDYYKDWMNSATLVPKLNESRFKRYSHHSDEYHINKNNKQNLEDLPHELSQSLSKCFIEGVKVNDDNTITSPKKVDQSNEDPETLKKSSKSTLSVNKMNQEEDNKKSKIIKTESVIDLEDVKKHDITNTIEMETGKISYIKKYFGTYKKHPLSKSPKKFAAEPEEIPVKNHIDLNSFDNVYNALMSTKKIIKERYNCHEKPVVNVRDIKLFQYKYGCRILNIINQKEIETKLHIKLSDEEKAVLNKIVENEEYYNIFLRELKESQSKLKNNQKQDNNDNSNENEDENNHNNSNNINNNDNNKTNDIFSYNYNVIHIRPDTNDMPYDLNKSHSNIVNERIVLPQMENDTENNEDYLTEHEEPEVHTEYEEHEEHEEHEEYEHHDEEHKIVNLISNQKYTDVIMNSSAAMTPATPSIYNDEDYNVNNDYSNKYNDNENDNDNDNCNDHGHNDNVDNHNYIDEDKDNNENNVLQDGGDPDGILEWCESLDHTKFDNMALI